ncbi:MAG TPA: hypothetical protein PLR06_12080 [Cyclobacteriaceae bacterium]|nr:hypothetical protein [Cyclobacteriaceae bacterium]
MNHRHSILALILATGVVVSCNKPGTPGIAISKQPVLKTLGGPVVAEILKGSAVEVLEEKTPDSSMTKIRFNGREGWAPAWAIVMNAKAAVVIGSPSGVMKNVNEGAAFVELLPSTVVAVDTVAGEYTHIFFSLQNSEFDNGWIRSEALGYDAKDVKFGGRLDKLSKVILDSVSQYNALLLDHSQAGTPLSSQIAVFKVNLSELPDDDVKDVAEKFGIAVDKSSHTVAMMKPRDASFVEDYVDSILLTVDDENDLRLNWYNKYIANLPSYVNYGPRMGPGVNSWDLQWRGLLLYRIDRSPENLRKLYETYKGIILPNAIGFGVDEEIDKLITVHDYIFSLKNYKALCAKISQQVAERDKKTKSEGYEVADQRTLYAPIIHRATYDQYNQYTTKGDWLHSFWVRRIAEGNADEVYKILTDFLQEIHNRQAGMGNAYNAEGGENLGEVDHEPATSVCVFQDYSIGDCGHLLFDCGDFGDAMTDELDEAGKKLWMDLSIEDANGERGNPKYIGKKFEITMGTKKGPICNEGQGGEGDAPNILSFKLVD